MKRTLDQERIVFLLAGALFVGFAIGIDGFLTTQNMLNLLRNVSILGILGAGMALVIIGRGIDLSLVANMAITVAWTLQLVASGAPVGWALAAGLCGALLIGFLNGMMVVVLEIPPLFATLAMAAVVYGFGRFALVPMDVVPVPADFGALGALGNARLFGVPSAVLIFAATLLVTGVLLATTTYGYMLYATGENAATARLTGLPTGRVIVGTYLASGFLAFLAGMVLATSSASMNTRLVNSTLIYDVILVVVLGGISLSGGRGAARNVLAGTLLLGVLLNAMIILDLPFTIQNIFKSLILIAAIAIDSLLNRLDDPTAQQGDI